MTELIDRRKRVREEMSVIQLAVHGAAGRMGARTCTLARDDPRFELVAEIDRAMNPGAADPSSVQIDALIDFSSDAGAGNAIGIAVEHHAAVLVGTTGLSRQTLEVIDVAARSIPVMVAANTSVGVAVLGELAARAARLLGPGCDASLIETHHANKRDAPSGTALRLAEILRNAGVEIGPDRIHAVRGGDVVGEHIIEFAGAGERLKICHMATSRDLFARGALRAMAWLSGRPPGRYTIEQALGVASELEPAGHRTAGC